MELVHENASHFSRELFVQHLPANHWLNGKPNLNCHAQCLVMVVTNSCITIRLIIGWFS